MKNVDITEAITNAIEEKIFKEWKHEGFIGGFSSQHINFEIDNREYVLVLHDVGAGHSFCEYLKGGES